MIRRIPPPSAEGARKHGDSTKFSTRVDEGRCVVNIEGKTRGVRSRRGDGTFGSSVPGSQATKVGSFLVMQGMVALTQIGAELQDHLDRSLKTN